MERSAELIDVASVVAALPAAKRASGALWLTATPSLRSSIALVGDALAVLGTELVPPRRDVVVWAQRTWAGLGAPVRATVAADPARWVCVERLGARWYARGATLLWGVELSCDERTDPTLLEHLARQAHTGLLLPGVLCDGDIVSLQHHQGSRHTLHSTAPV